MKIGVIGLGYLGKNHCRVINELESCELIGVCDINPHPCMEISEKYGVKSFGDFRDLANSIEAVVIATPTITHYEIARYFLERGIHTFLEKPMTVSMKQAEELINLAEKKGLILQIGHIERFNPAYLNVYKEIKNPHFIEAIRIGPYSGRGIDTDVILELMIHDLDIILSLIDVKPSLILAIGVPVMSTKIDIANARLEFENGTVANITASRVSISRMRKIRIFEKERYYSLDFLAKSADVYQKKKGILENTIDLISTIDFEKRNKYEEEPLKAEISHFIHCIKTHTKPLVSGIEGMKALGIALEIQKQIDQRLTNYEFK